MTWMGLNRKVLRQQLSTRASRLSIAAIDVEVDLQRGEMSKPLKKSRIGFLFILSLLILGGCMNYQKSSSAHKYNKKIQQFYSDSADCNINIVLIDTLGFKVLVLGSEGIYSMKGKLFLEENKRVHIINLKKMKTKDEKKIKSFMKKISFFLSENKFVQINNRIKRFIDKSKYAYSEF